MKKMILSLMFLQLFALLFSCSPKAVLVKEPASSDTLSLETKAVAKESWEVVWEKTLEAARGEGKVIFYGSPTLGIVLKESLNTFRQKYGLDIDIISGSGSELTSKLFRERANGLFVPDVMGSGLNTSVGSFKSAGVIDSIEPALILPEVTDPRLWYGGKFPWAEKDRRVVAFSYYPSPMMGINTELVKPGDISSWYDLLTPKWIGKIVINDPMKTGSAFNGFSSLVYNKIIDLDFFRQLAKQQPVLSRHPLIQADWLAKGKYAVLLWHESGPLAEYKRVGAPVADLTPKEGTYLSTGSVLTLVNQAPHPNASRVLVNWILGKEGQTIIQNLSGRQSAREDISVEGLGQERVRKTGEKYFIGANSIEEWILKEQDRYLDMAKEIFGPLTR